MSMFDTGKLPTWALVDYRAGIRIAGWCEERTVGGTQFIAVTPHGRHPIIINSSIVDTITVCDEATARNTADRQWVGQQ